MIEQGLIISPDFYDKREKQAAIELSIPVIQAFQPVTYLQVGFPVRVTMERELMRYVDHNFESEVPHIFSPDARFPASGFLNSFSVDEHLLLSEVRDQVVRLTARRFGRAIRPITTPIVQIAPFRAISEIARITNKAHLSIFEAGPGLGYLAALLGSTGHTHISFDVTQAMYLWQNRLFAELFPLDFAENVSDGLDIWPQKRITHLPWWQFVAWFDRSPIDAVDLVYSNSNLCEMSPFALRMLLDFSRRILLRSSVGLFCFFGTGYPGQTSVDALDSEFVKRGFCHVKGLPFHAYAPDSRDVSAIVSAFSKGIPFYNPSGKQQRLTASEVVSLRRSDAPLDVGPTSWYYGWRPPFAD